MAACIGRQAQVGNGTERKARRAVPLNAGSPGASAGMAQLDEMKRVASCLSGMADGLEVAGCVQCMHNAAGAVN